MRNEYDIGCDARHLPETGSGDPGRVGSDRPTLSPRRASMARSVRFTRQLKERLLVAALLGGSLVVVLASNLLLL
jgi:hypothetical protein